MLAPLTVSHTTEGTSKKKKANNRQHQPKKIIEKEYILTKAHMTFEFIITF